MVGILVGISLSSTYIPRFVVWHLGLMKEGASSMKEDATTIYNMMNGRHKYSSLHYNLIRA
jgi:hypothetical protein